MTTDRVLERLMTLHPKVIDLTLDRMHRLLAALGHPERDLPPVTHVAGTNGKGSTIAMIRAGLEAAGQSVHVYTSPHLARFHERIRLAGTLIEEDALLAVLQECEAGNGGVPITYFEITTCAALLAFARTPADRTLLEVGLGGRLDATNVIAPELTVITPVDLDHQQFLGNTLARIAAEKAGILKAGVPCVVARQAPEAREAIEARAAEVGAPLLVQGRDWDVHTERGRLIVHDVRGLLDLPSPALPGPHQAGNAGTAVVALRALLPDRAADDPVFEAAVTRAQWPARMQRLKGHPLNALAPGAEIWLDGGHNPAAGRALAATLDGLPPRGTHLICGMLRTKDVRGYMAPLAGAARTLAAVSIPGEGATLTAEETAAAAREAGLAAAPAPSVEAAVADAAARDPGARLLICGSLYLAGHVLRMEDA